MSSRRYNLRKRIKDEVNDQKSSSNAQHPKHTKTKRRRLVIANCILLDLPENLICEILSRLPVETIFSCKCVCKAFLEILRDPYFIKLHLTRASMENQAQNREDERWTRGASKAFSVMFNTGLRDAPTIHMNLVICGFEKVNVEETESLIIALVKAKIGWVKDDDDDDDDGGGGDDDDDDDDDDDEEDEDDEEEEKKNEASDNNWTRESSKIFAIAFNMGSRDVSSIHMNLVRFGHPEVTIRDVKRLVTVLDKARIGEVEEEKDAAANANDSAAAINDDDDAMRRRRGRRRMKRSERQYRPI